MMYGKHYSSMYEGSMVGAGVAVFAVMGFVIARQVPDRKVGSQVTLNPKLLAAILGGTEQEIQAAVDYLCAPDPQSRNKEAGGSRLVRVGQFEYQVVSGSKYKAIRDDEERREQNRDAKRRERAKRSGPINGETTYGRAAAAGASQPQLDNLQNEHLKENPTPPQILNP